MTDFKKKSNEPRDYKERFEFVLTTGGNIICQRYFRINNFNPTCLKSYELTRAIRNAAAIIDQDIKDKTNTYLSIFAPRVFETKEQMSNYFENKNHWDGMQYGEGIIVKEDKVTDYSWSDEGPKPLGYKFDDGEITSGVTPDKVTSYQFTFKVDGRDACTVQWDGVYPKFVRERIDLSNKRGKFVGEDVSRLNFEQYLLYKMVKDKEDLVYGIIKNICIACSYDDATEYTIEENEIINSWNYNNQEILYKTVK